MESPKRSKKIMQSVSVGSHDISDSEDGDAHSPTHGHPSSGLRSNLLHRFPAKLVKGGEPSQPDTTVEAKPRGDNEGANGWVMRKSVVEVSRGVAADIKSGFGRLLQMKSLLIQKLASMPGIPVETFEHARHSIESIVWEATHSAYGKTKEAVSRIRLKLVEVLPSLSPQETKKIIEDVEMEMMDVSKASSEDNSRLEEKIKKDSIVGVSALTASAIMPTQPSGGALGSMDRFKSWTLLRSRL